MELGKRTMDAKGLYVEGGTGEKEADLGSWNLRIELREMEFLNRPSEVFSSSLGNLAAHVTWLQLMILGPSDLGTRVHSSIPLEAALKICNCFQMVVQHVNSQVSVSSAHNGRTGKVLFPCIGQNNLLQYLLDV
eukprot:Gb_11556 [translate_table: standard]